MSKKNNEVYGISAEVFLAEIFDVYLPDEYINRSSDDLVSKFVNTSKKTVMEDFKEKGIVIKEFSGENGGLHDFILEDGKTLSVKTNIGKLGKVAPQKIGQMTSKKFYQHFLPNEEMPVDMNIRKKTFKEYVINNVGDMVYDYYNNLFNSDYLFYMFELDEDVPSYFVLEKLKSPTFNKNSLKLTKNITEWNSSNQLKYDNKVLGEFQLHENRDCFKFRFNMPTLLSLFVYKTETIEIRNEDCLVFLDSLENNSVDLILIDPPYKISRDTNFKKSLPTGTDTDRFRLNYNFGNWDKDKDVLPKVIKESFRVLKKTGSIVCFYDLWKIESLKNWLESNGFKQVRFAEWIKTNPVPINSKINYLSNARVAIVAAVKHSKPTFNSEYDNGVYSFPVNNSQDKIMPTQKPLKLIEQLICKHSNQGDLIVDCFSGSGTTMIGANNLNRKFIGTELNTRYYNLSVKRLKDELERAK